MPDPETNTEVTRILCDDGLSSKVRAEQLLPLVYKQLRAVAQVQMGSERRDHTLQATALVHEAYLRLIGERKIPWDNRAHFYTAAAEAMRRILLDYARQKGRLKRGGDRKKLMLNVLDLAEVGEPEDIEALDQAVTALEKENPEAAQIVRLRFYSGLSLDDTSQAMQMPRRTLDRRWEYARTWLHREIMRYDPEARRDDAKEDA